MKKKKKDKLFTASVMRVTEDEFKLSVDNYYVEKDRYGEGTYTLFQILGEDKHPLNLLTFTEGDANFDTFVEHIVKLLNKDVFEKKLIEGTSSELKREIDRRFLSEKKDT